MNRERAAIGVGRDIEEAVRRYDIPVLITANDPGVRRHLAQHIHDHSSGTGPFVMLRTIEEWEIDPTQLRRASVFIDDVGTFDRDQQAALMRLLDRRVQARKVRWRIITAGDARLYDSVLDGGFRPDLYYRLAVLHIIIPD